MPAPLDRKFSPPLYFRVPNDRVHRSTAYVRYHLQCYEIGEMSEANQVEEPSQDEITELEKLIRSARPWFEANGTVLIYALAAVLLIAAAVVYFNRQPAGDRQATADLMNASSPEEYRDIADAYVGTELGVWARLQQADRLLDQCVERMFSDREEALELKEEAATTYKRLADSSETPDEVRQRVYIGQARLKELDCDGSEDSANAAIASWQKVLDEYPNTLVKDHAEDRIAQLGTEDSRRFFKWFHSIKPEPIDPGLETGQSIVPDIPAGAINPDGPVIPAEGSEEETTSPGEPEAPTTEDAEGTSESQDGAPEVPETPGADDGNSAETPATETPATETPATETPATETPATETPATETPATETPATETPATETPATETPATETPATETPATETPATETPATETPATETPAGDGTGGESQK